MKRIINIIIISILCLKASLLFSQKDFSYKRKINVEKEGNSWNYFAIPDELYEKSANNLSDLRIYKSDKENITEIPYLIIDNTENKANNSEFSLKIINISRTEAGHFLTLENTSDAEINSIYLRFSQQNFDWKITLQGSHNQSQWFDILNEYRILAIKNQETNYRFEKLIFGDTKYKYYRILVKTNEEVNLENAFFRHFLPKNRNNLAKHKVENLVISNDNNRKQTTIHFSLKHKIHVHSIEIQTDKTKNFYRPIHIETLDSLKTNSGKVLRHSYFSSGIITSVEDNEFVNEKEDELVKNFRIKIENRDDKPLDIKSITIKSITKGIVFESEGKGEYFLYYGNDKLRSPRYDLENFKLQISEKQKDTIPISEQITIDENIRASQEPLFKNKVWLWLIMGLLILILGYFSLKMLPKKHS